MKKKIFYLTALVLLSISMIMEIADNMNIFYNAIIMPLIGCLGYLLLNKKFYIAPVAVFVSTFVFDFLTAWIDMDRRTGLSDKIASSTMEGLFYGVIYTFFCLIGVVVGSCFFYAFCKENKKSKKAFAGITGTVFLIFLLVFVNSWVGNPISKYISQKSSEKYIAENYLNLNLKLQSTFYNFKNGCYNVHFQSENSADTAFCVHTDSFGSIKGDNYENEVLSHMTTYRRIDSAYRNYGKALFENSLPEYDINLANFMMIDKSGENYPEKLPLDIPFVAENPPLELEATVWIYDDDVSYEKMAEVLTKMKKICDRESIPVSYYSVRIETFEKNGSDDGNQCDVLWRYDIPKDIFKEENIITFLEKMQ